MSRRSMLSSGRTNSACDSDEDGGSVADLPDLDACSAFGATRQEALAQVELAKEAWLRVAREAARPIPEPRDRPAIHGR